MHSLKLDVDTTRDDILDDLTNGLQLDYQGTSIYSGGGHSEIKFTGSWESLVILAARYVGEDVDDLPRLVRLITQVA